MPENASVLQKTKPHDGLVDYEFSTVLIASEASVTPDYGYLVHPLKAARLTTLS